MPEKAENIRDRAVPAEQDPLSEVFELVDVRGAVTGGFVAGGTWITRTPIETPMKLVAVAVGSGTIRTDGVHDPVELAAGDVAVLTRRTWVEVRGGREGLPQRIEPEQGDSFARRPVPPDGTVVIGGHAQLNPAGREILLTALPPLEVIRSADPAAVRLHDLLVLLLAELAADRPGSAFAARHYAHLVVLEVVRAAVARADLPSGWLRLLADDALRPAVRLLHARPGDSWRVDDLARAASMSRTAFATRFRRLAGVPPLTYLTRVRMLLAQHALRDQDARVGALAPVLGYGSDAAFSTAFKRETGRSPLQFRRAARR